MIARRYGQKTAMEVIRDMVEESVEQYGYQELIEVYTADHTDEDRLQFLADEIINRTEEENPEPEDIKALWELLKAATDEVIVKAVDIGNTIENVLGRMRPSSLVSELARMLKEQAVYPFGSGSIEPASPLGVAIALLHRHVLDILAEAEHAISYYPWAKDVFK